MSTSRSLVLDTTNLVPNLGTCYLCAVRIIAKRTLRGFLEKLAGHKDRRGLEASLDAWYEEAKRADWKTPADVKASFGSASLVGPDRVVFNIKGNSYRLVAAVNYRRGILFIKWFGTHRQYDAIDVGTVEYESQAD
jgi:mRNA interferase HigB